MKMGNPGRVMLLAVIFGAATVFQMCSVHATISEDTYVNWGEDKANVTGPDSCDLGLTKYGGSGMISNDSYLFGSVSMFIRLVPGDSAGTVTTFYLSSNGTGHDEIDFEFLGNNTDNPYTIHTNIFTNGTGEREEQFKAWFNPTLDFHNYTIFWNPFAVVWLVDSVPIRVFRKFPEINYPERQPMRMYASLWNADNWATQGGRVKTNWKLAPFKASFKGYNPNACVCNDEATIATCSATNAVNWYTDESKYGHLSDVDYYQMELIRSKFLIYDYCSAAVAYNVTPSERRGCCRACKIFFVRFYWFNVI